MKFSFRQLQAFNAVFSTGGTIEAGKQMGISQPAVSTLIAQLEKGTGLRLFHRKHGRLVPTQEADILFRKSELVIRTFKQIPEVVSEIQNGSKGSLRILTDHAFSSGFLPETASEFARDNPGVSLEVQVESPRTIHDLLLAGFFDLAICEAPQKLDGLEIERMKIEAVVALHRTNPLSARPHLSPRHLRKSAVIASTPDHVAVHSLRGVFEAEGINCVCKAYSRKIETVCEFIRATNGVSLVNPLAVGRHTFPDITTRPFQPRILLDCSLLTAANRPLSQIGRRFFNQLMDDLNSLPHVIPY